MGGVVGVFVGDLVDRRISLSSFALFLLKLLELLEFYILSRKRRLICHEKRNIKKNGKINGNQVLFRC